MSWRGGLSLLLLVSGCFSHEIYALDLQDEMSTRIAIHYAWDSRGNPSRILRESSWGPSEHRIRYVVTTSSDVTAVDLFPRALGGGWLFGHPDRRDPPIYPP